MKKALLALAAIAVSGSALAQGTLIFKTVTVQKADGSGTYNVPLFESNRDNLQGTVYVANDNSSNPAGSAGITVGLFLPNSATPFAQGVLGTSGGTEAFVASPSPSQTVAVPNSPAGSTPAILIRAWSTSAGSFDTAKTANQAQWREWNLTTKPLGGDPGGGALPITSPTLTGWGPETGAGYELNLNEVPEPTTIALGVLGIGAVALMRRRK